MHSFQDAMLDFSENITVVESTKGNAGKFLKITRAITECDETLSIPDLSQEIIQTLKKLLVALKTMNVISDTNFLYMNYI